MNEKNCPICHTSIPEHAPGGLCPACVLRGADETTPEPANGPNIEEIAAAFPKLEILRLIGHGGMGYVYQARQPDLDRMVALKILSPALRSDPAFEERFAREARVLGKLKHPNIVTLHEHGESGGYFYLMMEFVDGVNLRQAMSAGRFSPEQALSIVPAICDALQSAHAQGVWHRDIKPENILLDKDGRVKIADFGIARILGDPERNFTLTRTGGQLGSVAYMAPEQHEKPHDVDHRADIYSLGVVIYEMLTGELPLGRFPLPSQRAEVGKRIDEIVLRTLEKERELRHQSAGEVKTEVEGAGKAFSAAPNRDSGSTPKPMQWLVRWSLISMVGGGALAGLGFYTMAMFRNWGGGPGGAFGLCLGGGAFALGLLGSLRALYEMKRGWLLPVGRRLMIALVIWPLAVAAIWGAGFYIVDASDLPSEKGAILAMAGIVYGLLSLTLGIIFKLARPLGSPTPVSQRIGMTCFIFGIVAVVGCAIVAKRFDFHWPHALYRVNGTLQVRSPVSPTDEYLLAMLKKAAGRHAPDYQLSAKNGVASIVALVRETPPAHKMPDDAQFRHVESTLERLRDLLPPTIAKTEVSTTDPMEYQLFIRRSDPNYLPQRMAIAVMAGLAALSASLAGGRRAIWVVVSGVALHGVLALLPIWKTAEDLSPPRLINAPPLPPLTFAELPQPDFSTPENAVTSVYQAACYGETEVVRRGLSKAAVAVLDRIEGWDEFMSSNRNLRAVVGRMKFNETYGGMEAQVSLVRRDDRLMRGGPAYVVKEDGEWRLDSLYDVEFLGYQPATYFAAKAIAQAAQSPTAPGEAIQVILKAARNRNVRVFQNGFSKSFIASLKEHGEDLDDFGNFENCTFISANKLDTTNAEVVVEANDENKRRFTFPMILEDGEWRLNGVGTKP